MTDIPTPALKRLPDFVIIGAGKSASTWLHLAMRQHPDIFMPETEIPFFENPHYNSMNLGPLHDALAAAPAMARLGIKRPNYLCTPECAPRLACHLPEARLIAILRNPVDRAVSQYYHLIRSGRLSVRRPDVAFRDYLDGTFESPFAEQMIMGFGRYAEGLSNYFCHYPAERILVMTDLDLARGQESVFRRACAFVGVSENFVPADLSIRRNQGVYFSPLLSIIKSLNRRSNHFDPISGLNTPRTDLVGRAASILALLGSRVSGVGRNFVRDQEAPVSDSVRARLLEYYMPDIIRLEDMLNVDLSAWKQVDSRSGRLPLAS